MNVLESTYQNCVLIVWQGDITFLDCDAIVNAANNSLLGGSGVDGAIHSAAGPLLLQECKSLNGCDTGQAKITGGYNLFAKFVVHAVGPKWSGGKDGEADLLMSTYKNALKLADQYKCKSVALPAISTGVYNYPKEDAARIAIAAVRAVLVSDSAIRKVVFVCFGATDLQIYRDLLKEG